MCVVAGHVCPCVSPYAQYIYLSADARQPARGPTMWAHLVAICWPMLAYVGLSCGQRGPNLWLCWPMFASCWPMLRQKSRKMGTAKKRCKTQDILMVGGLSLGYVGPSWGYLGLSWSYVGPSWGYLGPFWSYVGPSWGYVGPAWRLCWPILGAMLAHLGRYVGPCWPILGHKIQKTAKNGKSTKHRKTREFLRYQVGRRQGVQPLSPTERREPPYGKDTARGPLAGYLRAAAPAADPGRIGK